MVEPEAARGKNPGSIQRANTRNTMPVLGPTWHGPQNLFVMEKKNQVAILCLIRTVDRGIWSQGRKCKVRFISASAAL